MEDDTEMPEIEGRTRPRVFKGSYHPRGRSRAAVYGGALVRPLATGMLPLMIVTLVAFLEGHRALMHFLAGTAVVILLSSIWTRFQLKRRPAAVYVSGDSAAVLTVSDVLDAAAPREWVPVFDLREQPYAITATIGYVTWTFEARNWRHFEELSDALLRAREQTFKDLSRLHRERQEPHP